MRSSIQGWLQRRILSWSNSYPCEQFHERGFSRYANHEHYPNSRLWHVFGSILEVATCRHGGDHSGIGFSSRFGLSSLSMQRVRQLGYAQFQPPRSHRHIRGGSESRNFHTNRHRHTRCHRRTRGCCSCPSGQAKKEETGCASTSASVHASPTSASVSAAATSTHKPSSSRTITPPNSVPQDGPQQGI